MPASLPYGEGLELQRALAARVAERAIPETIVLVEHPPVVTIGRRTEQEKELHIPDGADVELVETDRGGKSTYHAPGQLVCYPILDLGNHGKDVKRYVRDLERAIVQTLAAFGLEATTIEGLTGVWLPPAGARGPRKIASIGVRVSRWVTTHGYALNVDLDPAPFTRVDHGLRPRRCRVHDDGARARPARLRGRGEAGCAPRARRGLRARARRAPGGRRAGLAGETLVTP